MAHENSGPPTTMDLVLLLMLLAPLASGDPRCPPLPNVNNRSIPTNGQCSSASDCRSRALRGRALQVRPDLHRAQLRRAESAARPAQRWLQPRQQRLVSMGRESCPRP